MAANRKVDKTRSCGSFINFSIGCHDGNRVVVLSTTIEKVDKSTTRSPSWWAIEKLLKLPPDRHHGSQ
jgi:hypothetical protein